MKHLFLINPAAGKKGSTQALCRRIEETFPPLGLDYEVVLTSQPGDCQRQARAAAQSGAQVRIYACGGDGTLNEAVNGAAGYSNAAVTNVPKGTGNDFLKIFGPSWGKRFSDLAALARGPQAEFDLMDCNGKLGIGVVCAGIDARIAADVHKYKSLPLVTGMGAYGLSLVVNVLFKGISRPTTIRAGESILDGESSIICICNGRYYGGGFMPVGDAEPDDGILDMVVVPRVGRLTFFRLLGEYAKGRYRRHPEVIKHFHGDAFSFTSPTELVAVVDGEVMRDTAFSVGLSDKKVPFFYPGDLSYRAKD